MIQPDAPRILIVRLSAIGDTVLSVPVLCALRERFPKATIGWIVQRHRRSFVAGHADLNHLIEVPHGWLKSPSCVWHTARQLRRYKFNISLDLQGLTKSALAARLSGAKRRLGFTRGEFEGRELSTWLNNELVQPTAQHVVQRGLELLKPLGIEQPTVQFRLPAYEEPHAAVAKFVVQRGSGTALPSSTPAPDGHRNSGPPSAMPK